MYSSLRLESKIILRTRIKMYLVILIQNNDTKPLQSDGETRMNKNCYYIIPVYLIFFSSYVPTHCALSNVIGKKLFRVYRVHRIIFGFGD